MTTYSPEFLAAVRAGRPDFDDLRDEQVAAFLDLTGAMKAAFTAMNIPAGESRMGFLVQQGQILAKAAVMMMPDPNAPAQPPPAPPVAPIVLPPA